MNRQIKEIHIHCSATREGQAITADEIRKWHLARGWSDIGYHYIIGFQQIEFGRPLSRIPASVRGANKTAAAICYIGGLDNNGKPKDTRTERQKELLIKMIKQLKHIYPKAVIVGHRDLSPDSDGDSKVEKKEWLKSCPCFPAEKWGFELGLQPKGYKPRSEEAIEYLKDEKAKG
tara:strand:- start:26 stop:550 length:525 start_codon:yes stop_codon:yes gene_type:complete